MKEQTPENFDDGITHVAPKGEFKAMKEQTLSDKIEDCKCPIGEECPVKVLDIVDVKEFIKNIELDANDIFKINSLNSLNSGAEKELKKQIEELSKELRIEILNLIAGCLNELINRIKKKAGKELTE